MHFDSFHTDDEAQVFDFLAVKLTLLWFKMQASLLKSFQDQVDMFLVFFKSIRINKCLIKVCSVKSIEVGSENIINEILKCCRGIGESKWHNQRLKKAISGPEGGSPLLPFLHLDEVTGPSNV
jgi:hypothetical protein